MNKKFKSLYLSLTCGVLMTCGTGCVATLDADGKVVKSGWQNFQEGAVQTMKTIDNAAGAIANSGIVTLTEKGVNIVTGIENANSNRRNANANEDQAKAQKRMYQQMQQMNQKMK